RGGAPPRVKRGTITPGWAGFVRAPSSLGWFTWYVLLVITVVVVLVGVATSLLGAAGGQRDSGRLAAYGLLQAVTGVAGGALLWRKARQRVARLIPIDPDSPVHATALVFAILLFGTQLAAQLTMNLLAQAGRGQQLQPLDLVLQEVPFLLAAFLGVGIFVRRDPTQSLRRLGLVRPRAWQLLLALSAAGLFYAFSITIDLLAQHLTPDLSRQVGASSQRLFGGLKTPVGIAAISIAVGVCEESLFRGALQPRLGLISTALLFAVVHTEYGLSLDALAVLVLALALGLIRRYANTTTTATCHVAYNAMVAVGVVGYVSPLVAAGGEAVLLAATAASWWGRRKEGDEQDRR
ncbi:MAG: CPBP family intramembrane metalloprotease, partial [Candidatus Dormibacteraeota bacterium]|nr:CPBP family intramembrane metalloprotease [Candidatus Dormibacteraeota bacterium]